MKIHYKPTKFTVSSVTPSDPWTGVEAIGSATIEIGASPASAPPQVGQAFSLHDISGIITGVTGPDITVTYNSVFTEGLRAPVLGDTMFVYRKVDDFRITEKKISTESAMANDWGDPYNTEVYATLRGYVERRRQDTLIISDDSVLIGSPCIVIEDCEEDFYYKCDKSDFSISNSVMNPDDLFIEAKFVSNLSKFIID